MFFLSPELKDTAKPLVRRWAVVPPDRDPERAIELHGENFKDVSKRSAEVTEGDVEERVAGGAAEMNATDVPRDWHDVPPLLAVLRATSKTVPSIFIANNYSNINQRRNLLLTNVGSPSSKTLDESVVKGNVSNFNLSREILNI